MQDDRRGRGKNRNQRPLRWVIKVEASVPIRRVRSSRGVSLYSLMISSTVCTLNSSPSIELS